MFDPFHWLKQVAVDGRDAYFLACAREQRLADARLAALLRGERDDGEAALEDARRQATLLAGALAGGGGFVAPPPLDVVLPSPVPAALADKLLRPALPECLGYDLADVEVCDDDARWWRAQAGGGARWLVGIRTGGSYFVPRWAQAAGGADAYATVRPIADGRYIAAELEPLRRRVPDPADVVLLDDQPDSGATLDRVASSVAQLVPRARLWISSPGRVRALGRDVDARALSPWMTRGRLWERLADPPAAVERVLAGLGVERPAAELELRFVPTESTRRYDPARRWRPWNDPALDSRRRLVNPRKTPFVIVARASDRPWLHARFIGEGIFGRAEVERVRALGQLPASHFLDGYLVTEHLPGLVPCRDRPREHAVADQGAAYLEALVATSSVAGRLEGVLPLRALIGAGLEALSSRLGRTLALPPDVAVPDEIELARPGGVFVSSSLPYSHAWWHWRVGTDGRVRRFHLDALWGGVGSLEREIASFALEQRLDAPGLRRLLRRLSPAPALADICASLPEAALLWIRSWLRTTKEPTVPVARRIADELAEHWRYVARAQTIFRNADIRDDDHRPE